MNLNAMIPTAGPLPRKALCVLTIAVLGAASAVGCGASRPEQRPSGQDPRPANVAESQASSPQPLQEVEPVPAQQDEKESDGGKSAVTNDPPEQPEASALSASDSQNPSLEPLGAYDRIPEDAILGEIVSSFRGEDGKLTLYLNRGEAAKLRVGMSGTILEGSVGGKKLDGGDFTIIKVLGKNQSVAASRYSKSPGKNNRFMVVPPKHSTPEDQEQ